MRGRWTLKLNGIHPFRSLYVVAEGSIPHRNPITLRDTLRQCPELRNEYERRKRDLAKSTKSENLSQYSPSKGPIIRKILKTAGWTDGELDEMEAQNTRKGKKLEVVSQFGAEEVEMVEAAVEESDFWGSVPTIDEPLVMGMVCEEPENVYGVVVAQAELANW